MTGTLEGTETSPNVLFHYSLCDSGQVPGLAGLQSCSSEMKVTCAVRLFVWTARILFYLCLEQEENNGRSDCKNKEDLMVRVLEAKLMDLGYEKVYSMSLKEAAMGTNICDCIN